MIVAAGGEFVNLVWTDEGALVAVDMDGRERVRVAWTGSPQAPIRSRGSRSSGTSAPSAYSPASPTATRAAAWTTRPNYADAAGGSPMKLTRTFVKHQIEPAIYAIETDEDGTILGALDVTAEATKGGLCRHMIDSLPLTGRVDEVEYLQRDRAAYDPYEPDCGNVSPPDDRFTPPRSGTPTGGERIRARGLARQGVAEGRRDEGGARSTI